MKSLRDKYWDVETTITKYYSSEGSSYKAREAASVVATRLALEQIGRGDQILKDVIEGRKNYVEMVRDSIKKKYDHRIIYLPNPLEFLGDFLTLDPPYRIIANVGHLRDYRKVGRLVSSLHSVYGVDDKNFRKNMVLPFRRAANILSRRLPIALFAGGATGIPMMLFSAHGGAITTTDLDLIAWASSCAFLLGWLGPSESIGEETKNSIQALSNTAHKADNFIQTTIRPAYKQHSQNSKGLRLEEGLEQAILDLAA